MKVLFIGNSFTYYNDLPAMVQAMADAAGLEAQTRMVAFGGYFLRQHTDPEDKHYGEALEALKEKWDVVVLQEQSKAPAVAPEIFAEGTARLMPYIEAAGARPLFYMTWPYRQGSVKLESSGMEYPEMLEKLTAGYEAEMVRYGAEGVRVGEAFVKLQEKYPYLTPYLPDCYHPNPAGTYLAARLFFRTLFGQEAPAPSVWCPEGLDQRAAEIIAPLDRGAGSRQAD